MHTNTPIPPSITHSPKESKESSSPLPPKESSKSSHPDIDTIVTSSPSSQISPKIHKTKTPRDSRFELLRIIAMFMVLILHADFLVLHYPGTKFLHAHPLEAMTRIFFEMASLIAVNLFVLISGWWGIRPSAQGFGKFLFQCFFIVTLMYGIGIATGHTTLSLKGIQECIYFTQGWFIVTYAALYLVSPVLNSFVATASRLSYRNFLIAFYTFQTLYGCLSPAANNISYGYSIISFIGLYLLARYIRLYATHIIRYGKWIWIASLTAAIALYTVPVWFGIQRYDYIAMAYSSPTTILGALGMLMMCAHSKPWHSRVVNYIAASCFAVYLCHRCNLWTKAAYEDYARQIFREYSGVQSLCMIFLFMLAVFTASILIDQLRRLTWHLLSSIKISR